MGSCTADGNLLQPTGGVNKQYASHVTFFSCLRALVMMCHTTLAQVFVRVIPSVCHAPVCLFSLRPSLCTLQLSLIFHFVLLIFHFIFHVDVFGVKPLRTSPNEESGPLANNAGRPAKSGRNIKTRCTGSMYSLLNREDLSSIKHDRTQSCFTAHSQLIVSRKPV